MSTATAQSSDVNWNPNKCRINALAPHRRVVVCRRNNNTGALSRCVIDDVIVTLSFVYIITCCRSSRVFIGCFGWNSISRRLYHDVKFIFILRLNEHRANIGLCLRTEIDVLRTVTQSIRFVRKNLNKSVISLNKANINNCCRGPSSHFAWPVDIFLIKNFQIVKKL